MRGVQGCSDFHDAHPSTGRHVDSARFSFRHRISSFLESLVQFPGIAEATLFSLKREG